MLVFGLVDDVRYEIAVRSAHSVADVYPVGAAAAVESLLVVPVCGLVTEPFAALRVTELELAAEPVVELGLAAVLTTAEPAVAPVAALAVVETAAVPATEPGGHAGCWPRLAATKQGLAKPPPEKKPNWQCWGRRLANLVPPRARF